MYRKKKEKKKKENNLYVASKMAKLKIFYATFSPFASPR